MDEAHGVSEGRYRQIFGYKDSTAVVSAAVLSSCRSAKRTLIDPLGSSRRICEKSTRSVEPRA